MPRPARRWVPRSRLSERLSRGAGSALTLVSAPAGFGKTTLLAEWATTRPAAGPSVAWLSLDGRDNDPALFWTYVVAALRAADGKDIGAEALSFLESPRTPIEAALSALLNDLLAAENDVVLVLDDYHLIEARDVHDGVAFVLDHRPPQLHLLIATRADPPLWLARLRGEGELVEIRAADLRFTPEESGAYLDAEMGPVLTAGDVASLATRTEGWIAALQLAALSMQGRDDLSSFVAGFAGDDRYIVDYLAEEVLERQPEDVRQFLLQTSILDRLAGPLCDAVTGLDGGSARLVALERGNLFVVPLDDRRRWYRYHHLFSDVLQARLLDEQPHLLPELHRRASAWYTEHGESPEAITHALAAKDFDRAAELVELALPAVRNRRQDATLRDWMRAFPDDVVRVRPVLNAGFVGALAATGQFEGVAARLRDVERCLATGEGIVVDENQFRSLPSAIEMYRAALALIDGDLAATVEHARRVLDLAPEDDHLHSAAGAALLGLASWTSGDLEAGYQAYAESVARMRRGGHIADILGCSIAMADMRITQGRLSDAMGIYQDALQLVADHSDVVLRGTADMHVGMSGIHRERDDLQAAGEELRRSRELGDHNGLPQNAYRWRVAKAGILEAQGDVTAAVELLDEAERFYDTDFSPDVRPVGAVRARVQAAHGQIDEALGWVRQRRLTPEDDLGYLNEFEHITLARVLLGQHRTGRSGRSLQDASGLLGRLLAGAETGKRTGAVIEILVLQSLVSQARGEASAALASLRRAVELGEPEGYVRVFAGEGPPLAHLLQALAKHGILADYIHRLLAATAAAGSRPVKQPLVDPLSDRELAVLRLLASDLGGPDIARELMVSLNTMRTHTKSIYAKLGVNDRRTAVRKAQELRLLNPQH